MDFHYGHRWCHLSSGRLVPRSNDGPVSWNCRCTPSRGKTICRVCVTTLTSFLSSQDPARTGITTPNHLTDFATERSLRRPLLNLLRQIDSIRDLIPFFSNVSIASYESVYASGGNVDWEAVEQGIMDDMFDGRWDENGKGLKIYLICSLLIPPL